MTVPRYLHIAFYRFLALSDLPGHQAFFRSLCNRLEMRGTILLSHEGINAMLSGLPERIEEFKQSLGERLCTGEKGGWEFKQSGASEHPHTRMLVKIKREIISMGRPEIQPLEMTGKRLLPSELKQWIETGQDFTFIDTRNDYETERGTFKGAQTLPLRHFRRFPETFQKYAEERALPKDRPLVMFCTGGIRCEKATALAMLEGFEDVYQLDGGILRYFEETGGAHYEGECFVFDHREALGKNLEEIADLGPHG